MRKSIEAAEAIAREAHTGQLYGGRDYIEAHVGPVVGMIARLGYGEDYQATGWLHDVFEDSSITPEDALHRGVSLKVVNAAELLTKKRGVDHEVYLGTIATSALAVITKFADSSLNFASTVLLSKELPSDRFRRRALEYAHNIAFLEPRLPQPENQE